MRKIPGGVTAAKGYRAACCAAGIKYKDRTDMAMVLSDVPCAAVLWDRELVQASSPAQAVVVNAGIANAATGKTGMDLCAATAEYAGQALGIPASSVLLGSTGVIGPNIPLDKITAGIAAMKDLLSDSEEAGTQASRAIMTTDTVNKETAVSFELPGADGAEPVTVTLGGMCKGSGMIHPNMCTMLAYLTTDCAIDPSMLQLALSSVVQDTFNMITVDGDTSTNDTLLILANGLADNRVIDGPDESYELFREALFTVCRELAVKMAADGEGATHLIETRVYNADTKENAKLLARSVVGSSLVKAMIFGRDANCGRVLCALGYAGPDFDPAVIEVYLQGKDDTLCFYRDGCVQAFDEEKAAAILAEKEVRISCDMKMGAAEATAWGCDLTYDYVKINGDYRT